MSAASNPYSRRSWPSHSVLKRARAVISRAMGIRLSVRGAGCPAPAPRRSSLSGLCRRRERRGDASEDVVHVRAREPDGSDAHERDQRDEQRVLEQVLTFVMTEREYALRYT